LLFPHCAEDVRRQMADFRFTAGEPTMEKHPLLL
jgi:hypothetical protein